MAAVCDFKSVEVLYITSGSEQSLLRNCWDGQGMPCVLWNIEVIRYDCTLLGNEVPTFQGKVVTGLIFKGRNIQEHFHPCRWGHYFVLTRPYSINWWHSFIPKNGIFSYTATKTSKLAQHGGSWVSTRTRHCNLSFLKIFRQSLCAFHIPFLSRPFIFTFLYWIITVTFTREYKLWGVWVL
jgi:hypothetical protein